MKKQLHFFIRLRSGMTVLAILIAAMFAPFHLAADGYQFIVSGYPADNERYAANSTGIAIVTAWQSGESAGSSVEARDKTWAVSEGIAMRSDKFRALFITIR